MRRSFEVFALHLRLPVVAPQSFMVFFDWDRSNLCSRRCRASVRPPPPSSRAAARAVRQGVPADAFTVIGKGESNPLVATGDGVREP